MPQQQLQRPRPTEQTTPESSTQEGARAKAAREQAEAQREELDALLDEIDGVLEDNAAEFVQGYIQAGGE